MVTKWIPERGPGFPVGYAVSGILLTVFGYFAMSLRSEANALGRIRDPARLS